MSQWNATESGILRKNKPEDNLENLLVFGYACKLFRDDEKALYVDQGKHLIPWMGDETLRIDRYDGRGALSDLRRYEASREGYDTMRWLGLNESERKLEEMCDKERYYSLHINEEEEQMYKEEEEKRQKTNTFAYSYDVPAKPEEKPEEDTCSLPEEQEEPYKPSPILDVPVDIHIPRTVKEYARIEKTALFVKNQGPQMEILLKAKQADNPQFSFLTQNDRLYKFYRHLLAAFRNGRYQPQHQQKKTEEKSDGKQTEDGSGDHYLHPSLLSAGAIKSDGAAVPLPTIQYKPSANCAYSQLVNRIQGNTAAAQAEPIVNQQPVTPVLPLDQNPPQQDHQQLSIEQQQYYQYYYVQQYYEYYRQILLMQHGENGPYAQLPADFNQLDANMQSYVQQLAYSTYVQQMQQQHQQQSVQPKQPDNNSYAQIVSNVNKDTVNPYLANVPTLPDNAEITKQPVKYNVNGSEEVATTVESTPKSEEVAVQDSPKVEEPKPPHPKPLLPLAAYGSDSEDSDSDSESSKSEESIVEPSDDMKVIIDKMALYVAKNGMLFEVSVKARNDPRFGFLEADHQWNKYYRNKIKMTCKDLGIELKEEEKGESEDTGSAKTEDKKEPEDEKPEEKKSQEKEQVKPKKVIAPVSFSIKKAKEEPTKEIKSALPVEESDEETEENDESASLTPKTKTVTPERTSEAASTREPSKTVPAAPPKEEQEKPCSEPPASVKPSEPLDLDDPLVELMNAGVQRDIKRAEDKIKDKLAAAAREKLASVSRDKALQLERKRKAAAFLKLKSAENSLSAQLLNSIADKIKNKDPDGVECSKVEQESRRSSSEVQVIEDDDSSVEEVVKPKKRDRSASREKSRREKRSRTPKDESSSPKEKKRKKEKKKKHKRKKSKNHESRTKKKSKKHHRRSESRSSHCSDTS